MVMSQPSESLPTSTVSPKSSTAPLIAPDSRSSAAQITVDAPADEPLESATKSSKRRFFGLGKKKVEEKTVTSPKSPATSPKIPQPLTPTNATGSTAANMPPNPTSTPSAVTDTTTTQPLSPGKTPSDLGVPGPSPRHAGFPSNIAVSPSRLRSSSPRLHSPASSEIFERNVQEPVPIATLQDESAPAHIPSHVMTEDRIPPALEASAQAITSENLGPDEVEIVMSTSHQPIAASVLEGSASHADLTSLHKVRSEDSDLQAPYSSGILSPLSGVTSATTMTSEEAGDGASSYGQLDPTDVRRLSFISFADIVQSEHMPPPPTSAVYETMSPANFPPPGPSLLKDATRSDGRTASPLRSPRSPIHIASAASSVPAGMVTPPLPSSSAAALHLHGESSPARAGSTSGLGSPLPVQHGELTIETMRQAVRKTASGDLGGRAAGLSPVSDEGIGRSRLSS